MRSAAGLAARIALLACVAVLLTAALAPSASATTAGRGPYRAERIDLVRGLERDELPWNDEELLGFPARGPRDAAGVPMERCGRRFVYPTGMLSINGMKRLDAYLDTGDERQLDQALAQARRLRTMARRSGGVWWLPHACDYPPEGEIAPWWNAMTQGLAVSFFVRLHAVTGDERDLTAALRVARAFSVIGPRPGPWVSFVGDDRFLWLEHYPRMRPSHVLNAQLHAIIGLYELWDATDDPVARRELQGAITTIRHNVARFRRPGALSLYDLRNRSSLTKYHGIHVWQLRFLARITGDDWFWRMADRFEHDAKPKRAPGRPGVARRPGDVVECGPGVSPQPTLEPATVVPRRPPSAPGAPAGCG